MSEYSRLSAKVEVEDSSEVLDVDIPRNIESLHLLGDVEAVNIENSMEKSIHSLPQELLDNIFIYLDSPAPSNSVLQAEPSFDLTDSKSANLKCVSLVCHTWRNSVKLMLFRHARYIVKDTPPNKYTPLNADIRLPFEFFKLQNLNPTVQSFTLCIPQRRNGLDRDKSHQVKDVSDFWEQFFDYIDPLDLKIVAAPEMIGILTGCRVSDEHAWSFDMPYHLLQLKRSEKASSVLASSSITLETPPLSALFQSRPWTSLLLNEGSFMHAFKTYEYFHKSPPSILQDLVGKQDEIRPLIPATIREMSYIAVFPISTHFEKLTSNLPLLDRFYVQFVPRSDVLTDPGQMQHLEARDLWLERNSCYSLIMRELFNEPENSNFQYLTEFESGDSADEDAWQMAVEYVRRSGGGWRAARPGVFIKDPPKDTESGNTAEDEELPSLLSVQPGSL